MGAVFVLRYQAAADPFMTTTVMNGGSWDLERPCAPAIVNSMFLSWVYLSSLPAVDRRSPFRAAMSVNTVWRS